MLFHVKFLKNTRLSTSFGKSASCPVTVPTCSATATIRALGVGAIYLEATMSARSPKPVTTVSDNTYCK